MCMRLFGAITSFMHCLFVTKLTSAAAKQFNSHRNMTMPGSGVESYETRANW